MYSPVEVKAEIVATYDNPYDPDQIAVDAEVTTPEGKSLTVPAFLDVPMRLELLEGANDRAAGTPGFRVRYTPNSRAPTGSS